MRLDRPIIAGLILAVTSAFLLVQALRNGRVAIRGRGSHATRRNQPFQFWARIAAVTVFLALGVVLIVWGVLFAP